MNTTTNTGNNESLTRGVCANADGTWTALTFTASKTFKTRAGAALWYARKAGVTVSNESTSHGAFTVVRRGDSEVRFAGRLGKAEAVMNALYQWSKS